MLVGVIANSAFDEGVAYTLSINIPKPWDDLPAPKTFGEHLHLARIKRRWQLKKLAASLNVTSDTVINWEKDGMRPDYPVIRRLKFTFPELSCLSPALIYKDYPLEPKTFGERLRKRRFELDLSQKELAKRLGVCIDAIRDWEAGRTRKNDPAFERQLMEKL